MNGDRKEWTENMRWITPILVTICLFFLAMINNKVDQIDEKLFKHLTNDEMHTPRTLVITRPEFDIYQELRQRQMVDIKESLTEIKNDNNKAHDLIMERISKLK